MRRLTQDSDDGQVHHRIFQFPLSTWDAEALSNVLTEIKRDCGIDVPVSTQQVQDTVFPLETDISILGPTPVGNGVPSAGLSTQGWNPPSVTCLFAPIADSPSLSPPVASMSAAHVSSPSSDSSYMSPTLKRKVTRISKLAASRHKNWPVSEVYKYPEIMEAMCAGTDVDDIDISSEDVDIFANIDELA
jgi:hypothetical protein